MFFKSKEPEINEADLACNVLFDMIDRTHATIQFTPDGTIIKANSNFLAVTGYRLEEIAGKHHSMFVSREMANSAEYKNSGQPLPTAKRCRINSHGSPNLVKRFGCKRPVAR